MEEGALVGRVDHLRVGAKHGPQRAPSGVQSGYGLKQAPGERVGRPLEQRPGVRVLHDGAAVHDGDGVRRLGDHPQVVGYQDDGGAVPLPHAPEALEDLRLQGNVQVGGGLIGDEHLGLQGDADSHQDTLGHPAADLERVAVQGLPGVGDAHLPQKLRRALTRPRLPHVRVLQHDLLDLAPDGDHRVEGRSGVLEYQRYLLAPDATHALTAEGEEVCAVEPDAPSHYLTGKGHQPKDR